MFLNFKNKIKLNLKDDVLSGITVALALVPEAVAFSIIAHVNPLIGLIHGFYYWIDYCYDWW